MKITTKEIKQLIKEELQNVMKEQEQLDEGLGSLMALLFSTNNMIEIGNHKLNQDQTYHLMKQLPAETVKRIEDDAKIGLTGVDTNFNDVPEVTDRQDPKSLEFMAGEMVKLDKASKLKKKAGSQEFKSGNVQAILVNLTNKTPEAVDADLKNIDQATAIEMTKMPEFQNINSYAKKAIKAKAKLMNPVK